MKPMRSFMPGTFPAGALGGPTGPLGGLTFLGQVATGSPSSTTTFSSFPIGDEPITTRRIIVAAATRQSAERTLNGINIDGGAATLHENRNSISTSQDTDLAIGSRLVNTGTSIDIQVVMSGSMDVVAIGVWRLDEETGSSPHDTAGGSVSGTTVSDTINVPETGAIVAAAACVGGPGLSSTFTGVATEDYEEWDDFALHNVGGSESGLPAETGRTIQMVFGATPTSNTTLLAAISWQYQ